MREQRLLALIEQIYEAATSSARLSDLSSILAPYFGTESGLVHVCRQSSLAVPGIISATRNFDSWASSAYVQHYHDLNVWFARGIKKGVPAVVFGEELISEAELLRTEWYDYCRKNNTHYLLGFSVKVDRDLVAGIGFHRPRGAKAFDESDRRTAWLILPHVQRALQFQHRMQTLTCERTLALDLIDSLDLGLIIVGRGNHVLFANTVAERELRNGVAISVSHGRLRTRDPAQSSLLDRVTAEAIETSAGKISGAGGVVVAGAGSARMLPLLVAPLRSSEAGYGPGMPAAMVIFSNPDAAVHTSEQVLAKVYGLTPAEGRLLSGLLAGQKLAEYAERTGISINTAKTQMQHVFHKTGHSRQSDLIRAVLSDPTIKLSSRNGAQD